MQNPIIMKKMLRSIAVVVMFITSATIMQAQVTTSSMSGRVTDVEGAVIGATVIATHTPSGTTFGTITNMEGRFNLNGMRVGGPYSVKVSFIGYGSYEQNNITLSLGENYVMNIELSEVATSLDEVVISASRTKFSTEKTGAVTNITNNQIANMPTVSRSIMDITRLSPYGGNGMSFVGSDGRTANFTVDGANFNNNFGLSSSLPGGGSPISIESIEELQVVIAPYDVRQTNFIGGGVNAITKSGTNTFKASAYTYHRNENMRGDAVNGLQIQGAREKDRNTTYGFTLSGPIIKNKLFFFVNAEMAKTPTIANRWRPSTDGVADADNFISRTTESDLQTVSDYVRVNMDMKRDLTQVSLQMKATISFLFVWIGISQTNIVWLCVTTTQKTVFGHLLMLVLWMVVLVCLRQECHRLQCHMPTRCIRWITLFIHSLLT